MLLIMVALDMAKEIIHTEVDGRQLKLSNLNKVLYPSTKITKAEIIQYYLNIAPILLRYIRDRPLTVIRYPDGIQGKSFYSKDKPDWTPSWISSMLITHKEKSIDYLLAEDEATVVWLANLACLELHPMQFQSGAEMCPDMFIIDLDPDEALDFQKVKDAALRIRDFLSQYNYTPFIKTTGGKGLHIIVPITPTTKYERVSEIIKSLAGVFVNKYREEYTLQISKGKRKGKILIDIYRNHLTNTTVAPYSLRGKKDAPISTPIKWDELEGLNTSKKFNIRNIQERIDDVGDLWQQWRDYEVPLYDPSKVSVAVSEDKRLSDYIEKRNMKRTTEPPPLISVSFKDLFVLQLHNASNLHYDLRLEDKGILLSWAIPKGLPFKLGQKRLAIRTEDHPVRYLNFEGVIPKGEYGAGEMWIFESGKIKWDKKGSKSYSFELKGKEIKRSYHLYSIKKQNQWLIECQSTGNYINSSATVKPMLAESSRKIPRAKEIKYEVKWDGIRVLIYIIDQTVSILSRSGRDITSQFPELHVVDKFDVEHCVLDAEIVVLDGEGRPLFHEVISRMHSKGERNILRLSKTKPVTCYCFDLLSLDGIDVAHIPLKKRREWLSTILSVGTYYRLSESFDDGQMLFDAIEKKGMEGIMAKDQSSQYEVGRRSKSWIKIKCRTMDEALVIGYTEGEGDRTGMIGALHLAKEEKDGKLRYMGKVGTGFDQKKLKWLTELLKSLPSCDKMIDVKIEEAHRTHWVVPSLLCEVEYASLSSNGTYREPVFIKLNE